MRAARPRLSVPYGQEVALKRAKCSIMSSCRSLPPSPSVSPTLLEFVRLYAQPPRRPVRPLLYLRSRVHPFDIRPISARYPPDIRLISIPIAAIGPLAFAVFLFTRLAPPTFVPRYYLLHPPVRAGSFLLRNSYLSSPFLTIDSRDKRVATRFIKFSRKEALVVDRLASFSLSRRLCSLFLSSVYTPSAQITS